jgi:uncharacterized protein YecE (DUF72 family)
LIRIGTAGWSIAKPSAGRFPDVGSSLRRYAAVLNAAEINSSFYRPHKPETYARWAASVPEDFRFAVKFPRTITHEKRLRDVNDPLARFIGEVGHLGNRLGPLLVQLPPSLGFDATMAGGFFRKLRNQYPGSVVCEPRHAGWFTTEADDLLSSYAISRAAADPAPVPEAAHPGGFAGTLYLRLHGAPVMYHSDYDATTLAGIASCLGQSEAGVRWCIFDNTASGAALPDALALQALVLPKSR